MDHRSQQYLLSKSWERENMNPVHGGEEPGTALRVHEHTPMTQDGEEGTKSLVTGGEESADVLMTQLCPLRLEEVVVTKNALPDGLLEHCTAQATSEGEEPRVSGRVRSLCVQYPHSKH